MAMFNIRNNLQHVNVFSVLASNTKNGVFVKKNLLSNKYLIALGLTQKHYDLTQTYTAFGGQYCYKS